MYLRWLPSESATATSMRNELTPAELAELAARQQDQQGYGAWSHTDFLIAALIDVVRSHDYHQLVIGGAKQAKAPEPMPRPGVAPPRGGRLLDSRGVTYLESLRGRKEDA